jgi:hypothetical protein
LGLTCAHEHCAGKSNAHGGSFKETSARWGLASVTAISDVILRIHRNVSVGFVVISVYGNAGTRRH